MPLGAHYDPVVVPEQRFTVDDAKKWADEVAAQRGGEVGLVVDLTRSWRYYDTKRWQALGVQYIKVWWGRGPVARWWAAAGVVLLVVGGRVLLGGCVATQRCPQRWGWAGARRGGGGIWGRGLRSVG